MDHHVVAQKTHAGRAAGDTFGDEAARDLADARDIEDLENPRIADEAFAHLGLEEARGGGLDIVHKVVDD